ncbi:uncharacterized protein LOC132148479 [Carassius carassius]|uniref:uncharacterized protein LOC132148479 n=1 Tax=Carassius carassius TaxID=217509 RepID=UPI0028688C91|nr:uncharacterized protein LOC132148479 [Carassius carassius]
MSYGGGHFYTYHKLFSAKSAVRVARWNQRTFWGALDSDLQSRVLLGTNTAKSTSYVPRAATTHANQDSPFNKSRQPCNHFNNEIQDAGSRGGSIPNSRTSLFRTNIPVTHPLKPLLDASLDTILQVSPRTLQSYVTAWRYFKTFYVSYNMPFPDFSLLSVTAFISYLNSIKGLQVGSIKGYLSGIQFFHKLMYGSPSPEINNSQTSLLIKGIQRSQPTHPDARQPITLDILTKCIRALRTGYQPISTARTLDAMFILAFLVFSDARNSPSLPNSTQKIHPTISDLSVIDGESISYLIKQRPTKPKKVI